MDRFPTTPTAPTEALKLSELIGSLSYALDLTEGQPAGHCVRSCWIGMKIGRDAGMSTEQLWELYYTLLLKDVGCSSNAARICELYMTDDRLFKHDYKTVGDSLPQVLSFVFKHAGMKAGMAERFRTVLTTLRDGRRTGQEFIATRCQRGAEIARLLRFPERVAMGIYSLDEHFNGKGSPAGLAGKAIPVYARIALLAQVVDVFHTAEGRAAALAEVRSRSGSWFDPRLVAAFERVSAGDAFWNTLKSPELDQILYAMEPPEHIVAIDDDYLDDIATAFGQVVDSKSPYTSGHSSRVRCTPTSSPKRWASRPNGAAGCGAARCCTTWANSAFPTPCSIKPARSTAKNGPRCASMPRTPNRSCRASAPLPNWRASPAPTTSASMAAATRAV
jgi:hypothetical protein